VPFDELRPLLFTVAYEILGSAADAEDVVQDSYLRWCEVDQHTVANPRAYLARIVTRQALNRLRTLSRRREDYVGTWLPEPVRTEPDASTDALLAESVSMAMLLVLETLKPAERAVFVLHEVFGYAHREIADLVGKSEPTVRQIAHRAREHVRARRRRFEPPSDTTAEVVIRFLRAASTGDVSTLLDLLAPDVVHVSDGGGKVRAARRPVVGADLVARFVTKAASRTVASRVEITTVNALPAVLCHAGEDLDYVLLFEIADGLVERLYAVRNPEKLRTATEVRALSTGRSE